jgi:hypothetical protein
VTAEVAEKAERRKMRDEKPPGEDGDVDCKQQ